MCRLACIRSDDKARDPRPGGVALVQRHPGYGRDLEDGTEGWGHNSQWRTRFRRDYATQSILCFNADGEWDAREPGPGPESTVAPRDDELSADQRIELLVHRCFVRTTLAHDERWPWNERLAVSAPAEK